MLGLEREGDWSEHRLGGWREHSLSTERSLCYEQVCPPHTPLGAAWGVWGVEGG